jgi:hypothetical protein
MNMQSDKNAFVRHISFDDIRAKLPEVCLWDGALPAPDIFITAIGFEERAAAIPRELASRLPARATSIALLACYEGNSQDNACNDDQIRQFVGAFCATQESFNAARPNEIKRAVWEQIARICETKKTARVVFDISGSSSTLILSVMAAVISMADQVNLQIVYAEPETYEPSKSEFDCNLEALLLKALAEGDDQSFAEQGVYDVDVNELYPGHSVENRPDQVLAIPSFRTTRLVRCLAHASDQPLVSPKESIYWILGIPPSSSNKWRLEFQKRIVERQLAVMMGKETHEVVESALTSANSTTASTRDYRDILHILLTQIDARSGSNLSLVHMGSKLQAVGAALALSARSEVTVLHARPKQFNAAKYSRGVTTLWRLDFSNLYVVLDDLQKVGLLELQTKHFTSREEMPTV